MDWRINLPAIGEMQRGDVKILSKAGARVTDIKRIRTHPLLVANNIIVGGALFDVNTGKLETYDYEWGSCAVYNSSVNSGSQRCAKTRAN